jgi:hypothetical protein
MALAWKAGWGASPSRVRIPHSPPETIRHQAWQSLALFCCKSMLEPIKTHMFWTIVGAILFVMALPYLFGLALIVFAYAWKIFVWLFAMLIAYLIWPDNYAWAITGLIVGWVLRPSWLLRKSEDVLPRKASPGSPEIITTTGDWVNHETSPSDEEVKELMQDYEVDEDLAERAIELRDDWGLDDEDAIDLAEEDL